MPGTFSHVIKLMMVLMIVTLLLVLESITFARSLIPIDELLYGKLIVVMVSHPLISTLVSAFIFRLMCVFFFHFSC